VAELDHRLYLAGDRITSPLHSGQWLPQPSPDPDARTKAPNRMTGKL
jgi:hypothetical protein